LRDRSTDYLVELALADTVVGEAPRGNQL